VVTGARYNIISDIEGNLPFFTRCMELIDKTNTLVVLGDMWDRGTAKDEKKIWTDLSELKKTLPNLITIVGNRDINKLRWLMELNNFIPR
jgi:Icc-related predicted phosphoesterase